MEKIVPKTNEKQLHVFANDVVESVIAYDPADAVKVWEETVGEVYFPEDCGGPFEQLPDDAEYTLTEEETVNPDPVPVSAVLVSRDQYQYTYRATCRAWADTLGRCYFGSTEY